MFVLLWTDALVYLLLALSVLFGIFSYRKEYLHGPWRRIIRSRVGLGSLVVLAAYLIIGLLDTIHFHPRMASDGGREDQAGYSTEVISLFDRLVAPLRERQEKTFSAPFAAYLYAKENVELPDGRTVRAYPRLIWGGRHLENPEQELLPDVLKTAFRGFIDAALAWMVFLAATVGLIAWHSKRSFGGVLGAVLAGRTDIPWRVMLGTTAVIFMIAFISGRLSLDYHILGTDKVGEDVFYQALKSIRTGLLIGTLTTLIMLPGAIALGIMAGYFRGWVDDVIQYIYTTLNSIPGVLLIAAAILMLQVYMSNHADEFNSLAERADLRLLFLCVILGVTSWTALCRLLRGETMKLREMEYVQAATAFGVSQSRILVRHILPNVMHIVLITVVLDFSGLVLAEAVLSYVNIGVDPSMNSWGNMINSARLEMAREPIVWWSLTAALLFMFTLVLSANLFADVVRDAFDPRLRKER